MRIDHFYFCSSMQNSSEYTYRKYEYTALWEQILHLHVLSLSPLSLLFDFSSYSININSDYNKMMILSSIKNRRKKETNTWVLGVQDDTLQTELEMSLRKTLAMNARHSFSITNCNGCFQ